jgi:hypothetical protein
VILRYFDGFRHQTVYGERFVLRAMSQSVVGESEPGRRDTLERIGVQGVEGSGGGESSPAALGRIGIGEVEMRELRTVLGFTVQCDGVSGCDLGNRRRAHDRAEQRQQRDENGQCHSRHGISRGPLLELVSRPLSPGKCPRIAGL